MAGKDTLSIRTLSLASSERFLSQRRRKQFGQVALGKINEGMSLYVKEKTVDEKP